MAEIDDAEPDELGGGGGISGLLFVSGFVEGGGETAAVDDAGIALPAGPIFSSRPT